MWKNSQEHVAWRLWEQPWVTEVQLPSGDGVRVDPSSCADEELSPAKSVNKDVVTCDLQTTGHCSCPRLCTLRGFKCKKKKVLALDSYSTYQKNDFSKFRLLHLPIHRKVLNSLTLKVYFFFNYLQSFDIWTTRILLQYSHLFWSSLIYLRALLPGLNPQQIH